MRRVFISNITPGMRLGKAIRGPHGELLLAQGVALTQDHLRLLKQRGYLLIYGEDGLTEDVEIPELVSEEVRNQGHNAVRSMQVFLEQASRSLIVATPEAAARGLDSREFALATRDRKVTYELSNAAMAIVDEVLDVDSTLGLSSIRSYDENTFEHSVGVAVVAVLIGKEIRLSRQDLVQLATGCLLHDMGKIFIDRQVLNKPGKLTEEEMGIIKQHPLLGYQATKQLFGTGVLSNHIPYQHHERQDGTGYPRGLHGFNQLPGAKRRRERGEILPIAEVSTIADVYDALNSDRPYRPALPTDQIMELLLQNAGTLLNRAMVDQLLNIIAPFPVGAEVIIQASGMEGFIGVVVRQNRSDLSRPVLRILRDPKGKYIAPLELDLSSERDAEIESALLGNSPYGTPLAALFRQMRKTAEEEITAATVC